MPDRAAIVTGGSRGIGRAIAQGLVQDGYAVTLTGRKPEGVERAVAELSEIGADVHGIALNHTDPEAPAQIVAEHEQRFHRLDVLVNNAGVGIGAAADEHQTKFVSMMLDVNLRAIVLFYREAIALLKAAAADHGQSHVINLASLAGVEPQPWLSVYGATKAAVIAYSSAMGKELSTANVRSTALCPGWVDTDMTEFVRNEVPAEKMIRTSDIVEAVRFVLRLSAGCVVPEIVFRQPPELATWT